MIQTKILAAAAALTMLAATSAMAQDYRGYNRDYDSNAAYGANWDNDGPAYRGGYARYGNDWDRGQGWSGGNTGYHGGYASRNGFVCQPGTVFINENGIRTLCQ